MLCGSIVFMAYTIISKSINLLGKEGVVLVIGGEWGRGESIITYFEDKGGERGGR